MKQSLFSGLVKKLASFSPSKMRRPGKPEMLQLCLSLLAALFIWTYISSTIASDYTKQFDNRPVVIDMAGSKAESYGLSLLPGENGRDVNLSVNITIKGSRAAYGALTPADVVAYVDFDSDVSNIVGKQTLPIKLRRTNGAAFNENDVVLTPSSVTLDMDRYESLSLPVEVSYSDLRVDEETRISTGEITCEPSSVQVYGPSSQLNALDHILVNVKDSDPLTQTKTYADCTDFKIVDKDDNIVTNDTLSVDKGRFSVRIPVFYSRKLPVTVNLSNVPDGFDEETVLKRIRLNANGVSYKLPEYGSEDENLTITIETTDAQNKAQLDGLTAWQVETISLSQLSLGSPIPVTIKMDEGFSDSSKLGTIYVSVDDTDLISETRWIKNTDIVMLNDNRRYNYTLESPGGNTPVTLIGTPEDLAKIEAEDLKASVNLINISVSSEGVYTQAFTVTLPDAVSTVWVCPTPTVNIAVTLAP
ncbi:MAG TPA: hypothetical protein DCG49_02870 [Ruminococcus sp.]|nr:hypothetical protein [Ruminococcus sp.]